MRIEMDDAGLRIFADNAAECQALEAMVNERDFQFRRIKDTEANNRGTGRTWHYLVAPVSGKLLLGLFDAAIK